MEFNGENLGNRTVNVKDDLVDQPDAANFDMQDDLGEVMPKVSNAKSRVKLGNRNGDVAEVLVDQPDAVDNLGNVILNGDSREYGFNSRNDMMHKLINVGLLAANFGQLKVIISFKQNKYYRLNLVSVVLSIVAQINFVACMLVIWYYEYKVAELMKNKDKEDQKGDCPTAGEEAKLKTGMSRLVVWNYFGFFLIAVIIVLNLCLSVYPEGGDSDSSTENIGKTRYIGVINDTLQNIE